MKNKKYIYIVWEIDELGECVIGVFERFDKVFEVYLKNPNYRHWKKFEINKEYSLD